MTPVLYDQYWFTAGRRVINQNYSIVVNMSVEPDINSPAIQLWLITEQVAAVDIKVIYY